MIRRTCLLSALLCLAGCASDTEPVRPLVSTCVVQGSVGRTRPEEEPVVRLRSFVEGDHDFVLDLRTDAASHYRAEVPAGNYVISADLGWNWVYFRPDGVAHDGNAPPDTIRLGPENSPYTADFRVGSLRIGADALSLQDGAVFELYVYTADDDLVAGHFAGRDEANVTDGRLDLAVAGLLPGLYVAHLEWRLDYRHRGEAFWLPGSRDNEQAVRFRVGADSVTTVPLTLGPSPARLSGRVGGAWMSMGLRAPTVAAHDSAGTTVFGPWEVAADGSFALNLFLPVPLTLETTCEGVRQWVGGAEAADATVFRPQPGQVIDGIDITGGGLRLRVIPTAAMDSEQWAYLEFYDPTGTTQLFGVGHRLNQQIGVANLPPGNLLVRVSNKSYQHPRWRPQWLDRAATAAEADLLTIAGDGSVLALDLILETGGIISGSAASAAGVDSYYYAVITPADSCVALAGDEFRGTSGTFSFIGLQDGAFRVGVAPPGTYWWGPGGVPPTGTVWYPGTTDWSAAQDIFIAQADSVGGIFITVP